MLVDINGVVTGVLVDVIAATGRLLFSPVPVLKSRRSDDDLDTARWFETYRLTSDRPDVPIVFSDSFLDHLADVLRSNEVQVVLQELMAVRLTDAPNTDAQRVRILWDAALALDGPEVLALAGLLFDYYDSKITELVARLEGRSRPYLVQIRQESSNSRVVALLNSIERHMAAISGRPAWRDEEDFTRRYRRHVIDQHGKIEPPDFERRRRIPIDKIYVSPSIFEVDDSDRTRSLRELTLRGLSEEIDRAVLLGDPGAGKTTAANVLAHNFAATETAPIPFLVILRDYAAKDPPERSVVGHIQNVLESFYQCPAPPGYVDWLLLTGRALVIFDGLDELLDASRRAAVSTRVERFCAEYPLAKVLVTSRIVGYDEARLDPEQFACYRLSGFNDKEVGQYVHKWFAQEGRVDKAREWSDSFLKESSTILDLRSNPLLLSLLCILYRGAGSLPRKRTEVYAQCAKLLFDKWDARRKIHHELRAADLIEPALRHLARWLFTRTSTQPVVTERELVNEATTFLHGRGFESEAESRTAAVQFVEFCRGRMWVFSDAGTTADGEELYGFTHRTFLEYFTAACIAADSDSPELLAGKLGPYIARHTWDVVAELAIQIKDQTNTDGARRVYGVLLGGRKRSAEARANIKDFLAMCLRSVNPSPELIRKVTRPALDDLFTAAASSKPSPARVPRSHVGPGGRLGSLSVPASASRSWPQSLVYLLACGHPCRETVADEATQFMAERLQSGTHGDTLAALRLMIWLPCALPPSYQNSGNQEWIFWNKRMAEIVQKNSGAIKAAGEYDGGMRRVSLENGCITISEALAMPGGLTVLFESYDTYPCPVGWPPYLEKTFRTLVKGGPALTTDDIVGTFEAIGQHILDHPRLPWISGTVGYWDDTVKDSPAPAVGLPGTPALTMPAYLGAICILAILIEDRGLPGKTTFTRKSLGPLAEFYPYIEYRNGHIRHNLSSLPVPVEFQAIFLDWAMKRTSLVGKRTASQ